MCCLSVLWVLVLLILVVLTGAPCWGITAEEVMQVPSMGIASNVARVTYCVCCVIDHFWLICSDY